MKAHPQIARWRDADGRLHGWLASLGLALVIAGQPIGWWVRGTFSGGESPVYPAAVVLLGTALLFLGARQRPMMIYASPPVFMAPLLLVVLPVVALAATQPQLMMVDALYGLFMLLVVPLVATTPISRLEKLPLAVVWVGGISCALALVSLITNPTEEAMSRLTVAGNDNPIVIGNIGATVIIAALCHALPRPLSRIAITGLALAMVIGFANVLLSNTRSVFLGLGMALPVVLLFTPRSRQKSRNDLRFLGLLFAMLMGAGAIAIVAVVGMETITTLSNLFLERLTGTLSLFESDPAAARDQSTSERVVMLEDAWRGLRILGNGVAGQARFQHEVALPATYAHFSYLQILYDLGVFPFILYLLLVLVAPLVLTVRALRNPKRQPAVIFVIGLWLYRQIDLLTHGTSYDWQNLFPAMLLYAVLARDCVSLVSRPRQAVTR